MHTEFIITAAVYILWNPSNKCMDALGTLPDYLGACVFCVLPGI